MKRLIISAICAGLTISPVLASDAQTSATAGSGHGRNGTASGSASYSGDFGFARSDSRSGPTSSSRGVAVGVDDDGLTLSVSQAVAPRNGPAVALNFNLGIGDNGRVSSSSGLTIANGGAARSASAGGFASNDRRVGAGSQATGETVRGGTVNAWTRAEDSRVNNERFTPVRVEERQREQVIDGRVLAIRGSERERERDHDGFDKRVFRESRFEKLDRR